MKEGKFQIFGTNSLFEGVSGVKIKDRLSFEPRLFLKCRVPLRTDRNKEVRHQYEEWPFIFLLLKTSCWYLCPSYSLSFNGLIFLFPFIWKVFIIFETNFFDFFKFFTFSLVSFPAIPCLFLALSFYFPWSERSSA